MSSKSILPGPKDHWLIGTRGSITDISGNWYEQISYLVASGNYFSLPLHTPCV